MVLQDCEALTDNEIVLRVCAGETRLYEALMRRHNQRLFRAIRSVILDDSEAEDVLQDAWVRAYEHLAQFENRASFSTWVTKIAVYESLARVRKAKRLTTFEEGGDKVSMDRSNTGNPEEQALRGELGRALQSAVDRLPETYRSVFVLRDVEGMSTTETAQSLELSAEAVKTRLHRSRALLRSDLQAQFGPVTAQLHPFMGHRCDRTVAKVMERVWQASRPSAAEAGPMETP
jgi:RNA polymerase sigma-70 factor, ECF subfamily